jgi:hypothetical protein
MAQRYKARRPSFPRPNTKAKEDLEDATRPDKSTKEDKMESGKAVDTGRLQNISVYWLAFVVYWVSSFYSMPVASDAWAGNRYLWI